MRSTNIRTKRIKIFQINSRKEYVMSTSQIIKFWKANQNLNDNGWLSNFHHQAFEAPSRIKGKSETFQYSEQYFMYLKAMVFHQPQTADYILNHPELKPNDFKRLGRQLPNYDKYGDTWESYKDKIMYKALYYKFKNKTLRQKLLDTKDTYLVEASPYDRYWGAGVMSTQIYQPDVFPGKNKLGHLLMQLRQDISEG